MATVRKYTTGESYTAINFNLYDFCIVFYPVLLLTLMLESDNDKINTLK